MTCRAKDTKSALARGHILFAPDVRRGPRAYFREYGESWRIYRPTNLRLKLCAPRRRRQRSRGTKRRVVDASLTNWRHMGNLTGVSSFTSSATLTDAWSPPRFFLHSGRVTAMNFPRAAVLFLRRGITGWRLHRGFSYPRISRNR